MRWRQCVYAALSTSSVSLRLTASPHRGSLWHFRKTAERLIRSTNLQLRHSIFFCFSKRKRWRVRNDHGGTSRRKRRLLSSVLISSFPNRKLNLRFGFYRKSAAAIPQALHASSLYTREPWVLWSFFRRSSPPLRGPGCRSARGRDGLRSGCRPTPAAAALRADAGRSA